MEDENVKGVMIKNNLSRESLKEIYYGLERSGAGQWIKGHYAALSSIAYAEPLLFYVVSEKKGKSALAIAMRLLDYWEGRISQDDLYAEIEKTRG
jgi:hypothetical protein